MVKLLRCLISALLVSLCAPGGAGAEPKERVGIYFSISEGASQESRERFTRGTRKRLNDTLRAESDGYPSVTFRMFNPRVERELTDLKPQLQDVAGTVDKDLPLLQREAKLRRSLKHYEGHKKSLVTYLRGEGIRSLIIGVQQRSSRGPNKKIILLHFLNLNYGADGTLSIVKLERIHRPLDIDTESEEEYKSNAIRVIYELFVKRPRLGKTDTIMTACFDAYGTLSTKEKLFVETSLLRQFHEIFANTNHQNTRKYQKHVVRVSTCSSKMRGVLEWEDYTKMKAEYLVKVLVDKDANEKKFYIKLSVKKPWHKDNLSLGYKMPLKSPLNLQSFMKRDHAAKKIKDLLETDWPEVVKRNP